MPPPSQSEIARRAGVSRSTVAWALNPKRRDKLKPETRAKVEAAARELNYRPHRYAQIMRQGRSGIIGVLRFPGFSEMRAEREQCTVEQIRGAGFQPFVVGTSTAMDGIDALLNELIDTRVEGVILDGPNHQYTETAVERLRAAGIPMVMLNGTETEGVPHVRSDMHGVMQQITSHLIAHGRRRLTLLMHWASPELYRRDIWRNMERLLGFMDAIGGAGGTVTFTQPERQAELARAVDPRVRPASGSADLLGEVVFAELPPPQPRSSEDPWTWPDPYRTAYTLTTEILARAPRPDAFVAINDDWAVGALHACYRAGLRVPDDIAVTGNDNATLGRYLCPPLTSSQPPILGMAEAAVTLMARLLDGEEVDPTPWRLPCRLVLRESCGCAAADR